MLVNCILHAYHLNGKEKCRNFGVLFLESKHISINGNSASILPCELLGFKFREVLLPIARSVYSVV